MTPGFWPEQLEEWQCHFLAEMETGGRNEGAEIWQGKSIILF